MTVDEFLGRLERWRERLVPEWRITVETQRRDVDMHAQVATDDEYHHAALWIDVDFIETGDPAEVDVTIVHELLHLLLRETRRTLDLIGGQLHRDAMAVISEHHRVAEEIVADRVSRAVVALTGATVRQRDICVGDGPH